MNIKIAIAGDGNVGKTCFIGYLYNQADTVMIHGKDCTLTYVMSYDRQKYNIYECGDNTYDDKYFDILMNDGVDAVIIFFDVTNLKSFERIEYYKQKFLKKIPDIKIIVCGNKCDKNNIVDENMVKNKYGNNYCFISIYGNKNVNQPIDMVYQILNKNNHIDKQKLYKIYYENNNILNTSLENLNTSELFFLRKKISVEYNIIDAILKQKNAVLKKLTDQIFTNLENETKNKYSKFVLPELLRKHKPNNDFNIKLFEETIKNQNYFKIVLDIWNLNKENFISKYQNELPLNYYDNLVLLYNFEKCEKESILVNNNIFC